MSIKKLFAASAFLIFCFFRSSCNKEIEPEQQATKPSVILEASSSVATISTEIKVNNVSELYTAVNDPENAGSIIVLSPGTYLLQPGYPNGGRLELQHNMALIGQPGHPDEVILDVSSLPISSLNIPGQGRTGAVRMGDENNSVEWLTLQNDPSRTQRSLIQTDITATSVTQIRVAHCIIKGSNIGINVINRLPMANGRTVIAELENNEIHNNTFNQFGVGIQLQNSNGGIKDAVINATLRGNYIHDNLGGVEAFNASAENCQIHIKSYNNKIENNGLGIILFAGFSETSSFPAINNSLTFEGHATSVRNNTGMPPVPYSAGGVYATAGDAFPGTGPVSFASPGTVHHNTLDVKFYGSPIEGNAGAAQILAFGGHSFFPSSFPVGTYNISAISLFGLSKQASISAINSLPFELAGTNKVVINK